jgi:2-haloacid dehalogenase
MTATIAFDVYGTLIDTNGVKEKLIEMIGDQVTEFINTWRSKQLEYSFRRGLMKCYKDFSICTKNALDYTCIKTDVNLSQEKKDILINSYNELPSFPDVEAGLSRLSTSNFRLFAFSNGREANVRAVLNHADILNLFEDVISVDEVKSFKPDPIVYQYFISKTNSNILDTWLVSGNPFDVQGAISAGMQAIWIKRHPEEIFDPWEIEPTKIIYTMLELNRIFLKK